VTIAAIRTLIADDELLARRALRSLLANEPGFDIVGECRDGQEVVAALDALAPDLLFLDIQMPGLDGFGALAATVQRPVTVFVTAYKDHALRAFDVDAVDYLLKPFDDERFTRTLQRARTAVHQRRIATLAAELGPAPAPARAPTGDRPRIVVRDGTNVDLVDPAAIDWITALDYYVELHVGGQTLLLREPLQDLEARLAPLGFVRIHRSTIVNTARVRRIERLAHGDYEVALADGSRLRMSRGRKQALERLLR
jgi:two-component system, LytTR family, response regulator